MENLKKCKTCGKEIAQSVNKCPECGKDQRNFFMKHKFISILLALVVIGVIGSAFGGDEDAETKTANTSNTESVDTTKEEKETEKEVTEEKEEEVKPTEVSAADLTKAYGDNEVKADKTYGDKALLISGEVTEIGVLLGQTYVVLSSGEEYSFSNVQCFFDDEAEIDKVAELSNGDKVDIQGTCDGMSINVTVNDCVLK